MKYAVIKLAGKQFKVSEGDIFEIERQEKLDMDVLIFSNEGKVSIGEPTLKDVTVKATILENKLGEKINVSRYKSKSRYRRNKGHRQPLSVVKIEEIGTKETKTTKDATKEVPAPKSETKKAKVTKKIAKEE